MRRFLLTVLVVFVVHGIMYASGDADTARIGEHDATISVQSNISGAQVFIDTVFAGATPLINAPLTEGTHVLRYVYPDSRSWNSPAIIETVNVSPGETMQRQVRFPLVYYITSEPYGAIVHLNDSIVGTTPLICSLPSAKGIVTISKDGYSDAVVKLPEGGGDVYTLLDRNMPELNGERSPFLSSGNTKDMRPVFLTAGAAVLTGAASAYFKIKADGYYNDYRFTGNPGTLERVRRLDTAAGITLFASEMSLLALSYLLLSR